MNAATVTLEFEKSLSAHAKSAIPIPTASGFKYGNVRSGFVIVFLP